MESLTLSIPRSFLVVALSAPAVGFAVALRLWPERALSRFFCVSVSLIDPVALSPLLHRVFADGFRHWCTFRFCGGASPHAFGSVGTLGELRWLHLYHLTPDLVGLRRFAVWLWSSGWCFLFFLCDIPHVSMAIILLVSLTPAFPYLIFTLGAVPWNLAWTSGWVNSLPGFCHLRGLIVPTV